MNISTDLPTGVPYEELSLEEEMAFLKEILSEFMEKVPAGLTIEELREAVQYCEGRQDSKQYSEDYGGEGGVPAVFASDELEVGHPTEKNTPEKIWEIIKKNDRRAMEGLAEEVSAFEESEKTRKNAKKTSKRII